MLLDDSGFADAFIRLFFDYQKEIPQEERWPCDCSLSIAHCFRIPVRIGSNPDLLFCSLRLSYQNLQH